MPSFGKSFELKGLDHQFFRHLVEHTMKSELVPIFILVNVAIPAAAFGFERLKLHFVSARSKPLDIQFGIGMSLEDKFTRRIELSDDQEILPAWLCCNGCFIF